MIEESSKSRNESKSLILVILSSTEHDNKINLTISHIICGPIIIKKWFNVSD